MMVEYAGRAQPTVPAGPIPLRACNLGLLNEQGLVQVPTYSREVDEDRNLIYHLGVGGFHRSHQQVSFRNLQFGITRNVARTNRALARSIGRDAPNEPDIRRTGPHAKRL